jgi:hypothetical protein
MTRKQNQGADPWRLDLLREYVRSALHMSRLVLDEVLATRFSDEEPDKYLDLVGKAGAELAMLLRMAKRALPREEDEAEILGIARDLAPLVRSPHVYRSLLFRPSRTPMYALAHFCLADLGLPHENLDRGRAARTAIIGARCERKSSVPHARRSLDTSPGFR